MVSLQFVLVEYLDVFSHISGFIIAPTLIQILEKRKCEHGPNGAIGGFDVLALGRNFWIL